MDIRPAVRAFFYDFSEASNAASYAASAETELGRHVDSGQPVSLPAPMICRVPSRTWLALSSPNPKAVVELVNKRNHCSEALSAHRADPATTALPMARCPLARDVAQGRTMAHKGRETHGYHAPEAPHLQPPEPLRSLTRRARSLKPSACRIQGSSHFAKT